MPRRSVPDEPKYPSITPAPQQARFPLRRPSVKHKPNNKIPKLTKRQSTLTQVGWASSSFMDPITISSDVEDEVYTESRRKKRRRTTKITGKKKDEPGESQPTYTQAVRSVPAKRARKGKEVDEDGFQIWQDPIDDEGAADTPMEAIRQRRKLRAVGLEVTDWTGNNDSGYGSRLKARGSPEIPETSSQVQIDDHEDAVLTAEGVTPRNVRFKEIPSSQSPASANFSTQKSQRFRDVGRSPLRERSGNVRSALRRGVDLESPTKQPTPKLLGSLAAMDSGDDELEDMSVDVLPLDEQTARPVAKLKHETTVPESDDEQIGLSSPEQTRTLLSTPKAGRVETGLEDDEAALFNMPPPPPKLRHMGTIPETQSEDLELHSVDIIEEWPASCSAQQARTTGEANEVPRATAQPPPRRTLKRAATVQDSQFEDLDMDDLDSPIDEIDDVTADHEDNEAVDDDYEEDPDDEQATFDPAYSALDRDAARFGQTQTQRVPLEPHVSNSTGPDGEDIALAESQDPAAQQLSQELGDAAEAILSSQPAERLIRSDETQEDSIKHVPQAGDAIPSLAAAVVADDEDEEIPSSPPPLRPSQVSTVAPTQFSPTRPTSRHPETQLVFSSPVHRTPHKTQADWTQFECSSPLPLPPWSSPERARFACNEAEMGGSGKNKGKGKAAVVAQDTLGSLVDFSLPPPPPMSSSSRAGTQSGSGVASSSPPR